MGNKKGSAPPRYDEEFKAGAIRLVTEQGRPSKEVAADLGICKDTLRNWLKAAGAPSPGQADRQNREARRAKELEAENRMLRKTARPQNKMCKGHNITTTDNGIIYQIQTNY